jgi:cysteine synthase A
MTSRSCSRWPGNPRRDSTPPTDPSAGAASAGVAPAVDGILAAVGGTPLVELRRHPVSARVRAWAKLEACNPGGSAKARPASAMIADALARGLVRPGDTVVESTSGNMGVGLAQACRYHGLRLICVVDERAHTANVRAMRALGADVRVVTEPDPATGDLLVARLAAVRRLLDEIPGAFWTDQYANPANPAAHAGGTMREIDLALEGRVDVLLVATSTTGTLAGCGAYLRDAGRDTRIVAVDAVGSVLFGGTRGRRMLPGFGAGTETELSRSVRFDDLVRVTDLDCVVACRRLAATEAILAGASGGGVLAGLERLAPALDPGARCAVILADGGVGYLETIYDDEWVRRALGVPPERLRALVGEHMPADG